VKRHSPPKTDKMPPKLDCHRLNYYMRTQRAALKVLLLNLVSTAQRLHYSPKAHSTAKWKGGGELSILLK